MSASPLYHDWLSLSFRLLWCYDHMVRSTSENRQFHNNGAWLVRTGWAEVIHGGRTWRARPGQWLIVKPAERMQRFAPDSCILSVAFEAVWPDGSAWLADGLPVVLEARKFPALERRARAMARMAGRVVGAQHWDLRAAAIGAGPFLTLQSQLALWLEVLVASLARAGVRPGRLHELDDRLRHAIRRVEALPLNRRADWPEVARACGISSVHLNRLFRQRLGTTLRGYFERIRGERALRQLASGSAPKRVAHELGFVSLAHFSRWFRNQAGVSPRAYGSHRPPDGGE